MLVTGVGAVSNCNYLIDKEVSIILNAHNPPRYLLKTGCRSIIHDKGIDFYKLMTANKKIPPEAWHYIKKALKQLASN